VSPIRAELKGLAKLFVQVGDAERLIDECRELAQLAARSGVELELDVVPDMPHNPPVLAAFHPAAQRSLDRLAQFIGEQLPVERAEGAHPR
jgi:acetyl esterase/lipase